MRLRLALLVLSVAALAGCAPPQDGCGLIGCISSPYLRARGSSALVGQPVGQAIAVMGGAPTNAIDIGQGERALTWQRNQSDRDFGFLFCTETVTANATQVLTYGRRGNCGGGNERP